jgi:hypothetical protein
LPGAPSPILRRLAIEDEQCQKIGGGYNGPKLRFYCFFEWSRHFIYADPESYHMVKTRTKAQQDKATLAEVIKEMAKPRVVMSAREYSYIVRKKGLVVKNNVQK